MTANGTIYQSERSAAPDTPASNKWGTYFKSDGLYIIDDAGAEIRIGPKHNLVATTDPTADDDSGDGYSVGSRWINTATPSSWECQNASVGAAVWAQIDAAAGDAGSVTYAPATLADWDSSTDPGNVDDALDQLAGRTTDLEGAGGGSTQDITDISFDVPAGTTELSSDAFTQTQTYHVLLPQTGVGTDDVDALATITPADADSAGIIHLKAATGKRIDINNSGNIELASELNFTLNDSRFFPLVYDPDDSVWRDISGIRQSDFGILLDLVTIDGAGDLDLTSASSAPIVLVQANSGTADEVVSATTSTEHGRLFVLMPFPGDTITITFGTSIRTPNAGEQGQMVLRQPTLCLERSGSLIVFAQDQFSDAIFKLFATGDDTAQGSFDLSGVSTGQNRVVTWPDANISLVPGVTFSAEGHNHDADYVSSVSGTADEITSSGGLTPAVGLADNPIVPGTESLTIPGGTTAQRPGTPAEKMTRYNSSDKVLEYWNGTAWVQLDGTGGGTAEIATGAYTGDGNATQGITGLGFQPGAVYIHREAGGTGTYQGWKTSGDGTKTMMNGASTAALQYLDDHIVSLDADGFTLGDGSGSSNQFNVNATVYNYIAWKA